MSGIPVFEALPARPGVFLPTLGWADPTHIARTVPEDEAREAVIAAAREVAHTYRFRELEDALDRLDALPEESPS